MSEKVIPGKPTLEVRGGIYVFKWEAEKLQATLDRMHDDHRGTLSAELTLKTMATEPPQLLHQSRINLTSLTGRNTVSKHMDQRWNTHDWPAVVEQICALALERYRLGEPVEELCTADDIQPPTEVLPGILYEALPSILFGPRSVGKSTIAQSFAQVVQLPWPDNPMGIAAPSESYPVLYLDWETTRETVLWQLKKLQNGMSPKMPFFMQYRRCIAPLADDVEQLRAHIINTGSRVVIIDSLGPAVGGDLNDAGQALRFFCALSQLKVTSLILAHVSKGLGTGERTVFGSVFFENEARCIWEVRGLQEAGEDTLEVGLFHRKSPPFMGKQKPFGYKLSYTPTTTRIVPQNPETVREFVDAMGTQARAKAHVLENGPQTAQQIAGALQITLNNAKQAAKRLKEKGEFRLFKDGKDWKYDVSEAEQE